MVKVLCVICVFAATQVFTQTTSGTITSNETWSGTIDLTGNLTLQSGTLTIQPGTRVNGHTRDFKITGAGIIKAVGTASNRITFSGTKFVIEALTNDLDCIFDYCDLVNNTPVLEFRNESGNELSTMTFDHCLFRDGGYCLMYVTSGGSPIIRNSEFDNGNTCIFSHGGDVLDVSYTVFKNTSCGIVSGGMGATKQFWEPMHTIVNHCVFYNIIAGRAPSYISPVDGYGICSLNYAGTMDIANCIFHTITNSSIRDWNIEDRNCTWGYWTINADYNCHYQLGGDPIRLKTVGSHSLQTNPLMTNPASGDYSLQTTSPCRNKASDGTHIGAWQNSGVNDRFVAGGSQPAAGITLSANPFQKNITVSLNGNGLNGVSIYDVQGRLLRQLENNNGSYTWDSRGGNNTPVPPGLYWVAVHTEQGMALARIVKAE